MTVISWTIINNEIDFLPDILDYHLPWLDKMYFLDTGSTDGTLEFLRAQNNNKIVVQEYPVKFTPQYEKKWEEMAQPFPEVEVRNFALEQVEKFGSDWLLQLDGDEVFISSVKFIIEENKNYSIIGHSTINPVEALKKHPIERRQGHILYDPHARIWRNGLGIRYQNNPAFAGKQYHCIPVLNGRHIYHSPKIKFIPDPIHFHLHWMYGKKVERFYPQMTALEIASKQEKPNSWQNLLPDIFFQRRQERLLLSLKEKILIEPFEKFRNKKQNSETVDNLTGDILNAMRHLENQKQILIPMNFYPHLQASQHDQSSIEIYFRHNEKIISGTEGLLTLIS